MELLPLVSPASSELPAHCQNSQEHVLSPFRQLSTVRNRHSITAILDDNLPVEQDKLNTPAAPLLRTSCSDSSLCTSQNLSIDNGSNNESDFMMLGSDPLPSGKNLFSEMTLTELLDTSIRSNVPPTTKEFKVILFNDALKTGLFSFSPNLIADIRSGLLATYAPSYKYLASIAISIVQTKAVLAEFKQQGKLSETEYNTLNAKLAQYANSLSEIGNGYYHQLAKRPRQDTFKAFLMIRNHRNNGFTKLFKQAAALDKELKLLIAEHAEVKTKIDSNLNHVVTQFIKTYFNLEGKEEVKSFQQLNQYIRPRAYNQIQALFRDESRNRPGHQFDSGGIEHLYDCYAEIFDHFKTSTELKNEQNKVDRALPPAGSDLDNSTAQTDPMATINNQFSPVFNPINSPNFVNNINDKLTDILDKLKQKPQQIHQGSGTNDRIPSRSQEAAVDTVNLMLRKKESVGTQILNNQPLSNVDQLATSSTDNHDNNEWINDDTAADSATSVIASNSTTPTIMTALKGATQLSHDAYGYSHQPFGMMQSELEKVKLKPTTTRKAHEFKVNSHYRDRDYYDESGKVLPGFVMDRVKAFENNGIDATTANVNDVDSKHHSQSTDWQNELDRIKLKLPKVQTLPHVVTTGSDDSKLDKSLSDKLANAAQDVASELTKLIDTAMDQQGESISSIQAVTELNDTYAVSDVVVEPAKKIFKAERIENNNAFFAILKSDK